MKTTVSGFLVAVLTLLGTGIGEAQFMSPVKPMTGAKAETQINEGVRYLYQGQTQTAYKHFQDAVKEDPRSAEAHYNLALTLDKMGDKQKATKHFQQAATLGQFNPLIRHSKILKDRLQK